MKICVDVDILFHLVEFHVGVLLLVLLEFLHVGELVIAVPILVDVLDRSVLNLLLREHLQGVEKKRERVPDRSALGPAC